MKMSRIVWIFLALALASSAAFGQTAQGNVTAGSTAIEVVGVIASGWQQGGGACSATELTNAPGGGTRARLTVSQLTGPCAGRKVRYEITAVFGTLLLNHCFYVRPVCNPITGRLDAFVDFEPTPLTCATPEFCAGSEEEGLGMCSFDFGEILVDVVEEPITGTPVLGPRLAVALTLGFLAIGVFVLVRRGVA